MSKGSEGFPYRHREGLLSSVSTGLFLVLAGTILIATPNLLNNIYDFFHDFTTNAVPNLKMYLPAPKTPEAHTAVYAAAEQFSLIWALLQTIVLILRFAIHSPLGKKAETMSNAIFWLGTTYLIKTMLIATALWFEFWANMIMLLGLTLIIRAIIMIVGRQSSRRHPTASR